MDYKYDAFISYRHCDLDKFVAENLHKQLEAFKLPRNIAKKENLPRKKIERVFRDRDELPLASNLEDPIIDALTTSDYLIVICSPRLKDSIWCQKEIQTFIKMHGRHKVLAVLIEGEPEDSFPKELLFDDNGNPVEPLAADVRGENKGKVKKAIKAELLRLLAPMFGIGYDDLKQRHKEQRMKKIAGLVAVCGAVGIAFGVVCASAALRINAQKKQIEQQNVILANSQAESLSKQALEIYEKEDRHAAVELAYKAMTEYEGVKMPQTAYSERTLVECMSVYDGAILARCARQIEMPGVIKDMKVSPSGKYVVAADNIGDLIAYDISTQESVYELKLDQTVEIFDFLNDDTFYLVTNNGGLQIANITSQSLESESKDESIMMDIFWDAKVLPNGNIAALAVQDLKIYDPKTAKEITHNRFENSAVYNDIYINDKNGDIYLVGTDKDGMEKVGVYDCDTLEEKAVIDISEGNVFDACFGDNEFYVPVTQMSLLGSGSTKLIAINTDTFEKDLDVLVDDISTYKMLFSKGKLLLIAGSQMKLVNATTGANEQNFFDEEKVIYDFTGDSGDFLFFTENGYSRSIKIDEPYTDLAFGSFASSDIAQYEMCESCIIGRKNNDNRILLYSYLINKDASVYESEEYAPAKNEQANADQAKEWAIENGIENASFVNGYVEMEDIKAIAVSYLDNSLVIYDSSTREMKAEYKDISSGALDYYGKIADYYLVQNGDVAFLFDEDGGMRAKIQDFAGVSKDNKSIVIYGRDMETNKTMISIPVYTRKGLLDKTKEYLDR